MSRTPNDLDLTDPIWAVQNLLLSIPECLACISGMKPTGDVLSELKRFENKWQEVAKVSNVFSTYRCACMKILATLHSQNVKHVIWRSREVAELLCDVIEGSVKYSHSENDVDGEPTSEIDTIISSPESLSSTTLAHIQEVT